MSDAFLTVDRLAKSFAGRAVLSDLSFAVRRGEVLALLGPSGSGKTTALRLLAGFESCDRGRIVVDGEDVTATSPARRGFGMVFQHYALFPHLSVGENVAFGLEARGWKRERARARVAEALALVDLPGQERARVDQLSGGMQQRVALARALAPEPRVLLLDEPLSNLDPSLRERTRQELLRTIRRVGITTVLVTHEQEEAFDLGDRIAVLYEGRLQQVGTARELYAEPLTRFVAEFIGRSRPLRGVLLGNGVRFPNGVCWAGKKAGPIEDGAPVDLLVRPESLSFADSGAPSLAPLQAWRGIVQAERFAGAWSFFAVELDAGEVEVLALPGSAPPGTDVWVAQRPGAVPPSIFEPAPERE